MNEVEKEDDPLEINVAEDDKQEVSQVEDETNQEIFGRQAAENTETEDVSEKAETTEAEETPKKGKFQKRIDDLTKRQREAERQRDEYYKVANSILEENKKLRDQAQSFTKFGATEMETRIESDIKNAETAYKSAYEEGDAEKIVQAQRKMIDAATQRGKLDQVKQASDPSNYESKVPDLVPPPNSRAVEWASRNPWFNNDMVMTNAAYTVHDELMKTGVTADSEDYYAQLDLRLSKEFPHKLSEDKTSQQKDSNVSNNQTVVTPAGNQVPHRSRKVRLTPSQVAVANRLGVPLEEYAKQFVALNN
jgi:hypothetical protein